MNSKEEILEHHRQMLTWVESLDGNIWRIPVADGKWSAAEIVSHFTEWDRFIIEKRLPFLFNNENLPQSDIENVNAKAAENAGNSSREKLIADFLKTRAELLQKLEEFGEEKWSEKFAIGGDEMTLLSYFKGHAEHDNHHRKQIDPMIF